MKKLTLIILTAILLVGCSSQASANVKQAELAKYKDQSIDSTTLFEIAKANNNIYTLSMHHAIVKVGEKEISEEDVKVEVDKTIKSYEDSYGDTFISQLASAGYFSVEDFIDRALKPQAYQKLLKDKYVDEQRETIINEYQFKKVRILEFGNEADAQAAINTLEMETATWEEIEKENNSRDLGVVYKGISTNSNNRIPKEVEEAAIAVKEKGLITKVVSSNGKFYVVDIVETDAEALKAEIDIVIETLNELGKAAMKYYFKQHNLKFYDQELSDAFDNEYKK